MTLKSKQIEHAREGMHADGQGLYLRVQPSGAKSWIFRYQLNRRRREMGLGTLDELSPPAARAEAARQRERIAAGIDPIDARRAERAARTAIAPRVPLRRDAGGAAARPGSFRAVAEAHIDAQAAGWRNAKHAAQWLATLQTYAFPAIGDKSVAEVDTEDVLRILVPIWSTKTETASRVRSRIELVLSAAKARGQRAGENPAAWRGHLDALLPSPRKVTRVQHRPALPYEQVPDFFDALQEQPGRAARALELLILTACRTIEVRGMLPSEVDAEATLWTVPGERMKSGREQRVPLAPEALELIVKAEPVERNPYVFAGAAEGRPLSDMALAAVVRRMNAGDAPRWVDRYGEPIVPHGFRSSFRDWAAEQTSHQGEVAEMALAHVVSDATEAAYRRGDLLEKRRLLMDEWAAYVTRRRARE